MQIIQQNNEILRKVAEEVDLQETSPVKTQDIIKEMKKALDETENGIAIAAPQIGKSVRIFVVSDLANSENTIFVNPKITQVSEDKETAEEGCLSVDKGQTYGNVERFSKCRVEAFNQNGEKFTQDADDFLARIFQHEIDHLNGILFIDKAKNLQKITN